MSLRTECGACGGSRPEVFLDLGETPLANKYPATVDETETWYPLQLGRCLTCGTVQNMALIDDAEMYGDDYGFYSGASEAQRRYHQQGAAELIRRYPDRGFTVEVACNDGALLKHLHADDPRCVGVDPARPALAAADAGLPVLVEPFTLKLAQSIREEHGPADLVIAYNSLAHVSDLPDVLDGIKHLLADNGVAVVEVQYLADLITGGLMGQVYHEHRFFWSLETFGCIAVQHGLYVVDAELIELQGGGIRMTLSKDEHRRASVRTERIVLSEQWLRDSAPFVSMQGRLDRTRTHLRQLLVNEQVAGREVVGYAAAAKATTILNFCDIRLPAVLDTTEYKWGRFVPGVKTPIIPPDHYLTEPDRGVRLLLTANYLPWLLRHDTEFNDRGGRWLLAEPFPMVV